MYTLYFSPGTCSLAVHTILNLLKQEPELVFAGSVEHFEQVNPAKMVPALKKDDSILTEGAAIILHLLETHPNTLLAKAGAARQQGIENMMLANATMHPSYGRLFFADANLDDGPAKEQIFKAATHAINAIWQVVESKFADGPYLGGHQLSPADILLAVYATWGQYFPVDITIGPKTQRMIDLVQSSDAFQMAQQREAEEHAHYAA